MFHFPGYIRCTEILKRQMFRDLGLAFSSSSQSSQQRCFWTGKARSSTGSRPDNPSAKFLSCSHAEWPGQSTHTGYSDYTWLILQPLPILFILNGWVEEKIETENHGFSQQIWGCPLNFPLNQSNDIP